MIQWLAVSRAQHALQYEEKPFASAIHNTSFFEDGQQLRGVLDGFVRGLDDDFEQLEGGINSIFNRLLSMDCNIFGYGQNRPLDRTDYAFVGCLACFLKCICERRRVELFDVIQGACKTSPEL